MLAIKNGVYISSISISLEGRTRAAIDDHSGNKLIRSDVEQSVVSPSP